MENSNQKKPIDYDKYYGIYRKLPTILCWITFALFFIWSIIDASNEYYGNYGVFGFDYWFPVLLVWWLIGAVVAVIVYFGTAIKISPIIKSTDALLNIEKSKSEEAQ